MEEERSVICHFYFFLFPNLLPLLSLSRKLSELELQAAREQEGLELPPDVEEEDEEEEGKAKMPEDMTAVQLRIKENIHTLQNFKALRDPNRSRKEYTRLLEKVRFRAYVVIL